MAVDVRERAEPAELHVIQEVGMVERLGDAREAHRTERGWIREAHAFRISHEAWVAT